MVQSSLEYFLFSHKRRSIVKDELQWMVRKLSSGITGPKIQMTGSLEVNSFREGKNKSAVSTILSQSTLLYIRVIGQDAFGMV